MKIERVLFWFKAGGVMLNDLNKAFFGLGTLLNRMLNQSYDGKRKNLSILKNTQYIPGIFTSFNDL